MRHLTWLAEQLVLSVVGLLVVPLSAASLVQIETVKRSALLVLRSSTLVVAESLLIAVGSSAALVLSEVSLVVS